MFSIIMVTYLPTILMNILNQATNYLTGDSKYDLVITVNITSMMVLASIYLSVSTSLPSTPNIKPVEIWLLFNLAYPFLVILVNIFLSVSKISTSRPTSESSSKELNLGQSWSELFELFDYSHSKDRIVVFGIRIRSIFKTRIVFELFE